jgi:prolyl oligopeptidase
MKMQDLARLVAMAGAVSLAGAAFVGCAKDRAASNDSAQPERPTQRASAPAPSRAAATETVALAYPDARRVEHYDTYHGVRVHDPYRWLENPDSPETRAWIEAQNAVTFAYLENIPERAAIEKRLTELWNYERYGMPFEEGGRYFFSRNSGLQNQSVLYVAEYLDGEARELLDPNTLSEDGTVSLGGIAVSPDGKHLAYATSDGGSDWRTWRVRSVDTGRDLPDVINWSKFSGAAWDGESKGFYYSRYAEPSAGSELEGQNYFQKLYYHRLGTDQGQDVLVYERPDKKEWGFNGSVTDDGKFLIITVWEGTSRKNRVYYKSLATPNAPVVRLLDTGDAQYAFIGNEGSTFFFRTDLDASRGRVIAIDINNSAASAWKTIIPESDETLQGVSHIGGHIVATYLEDAKSAVKIFTPKGRAVREVALPGIGSVGGFGGEADSPETFYSFTSYTDPGAIYRYDMATGKSELWRRPVVDFNPDAFVTKQVFYTSKDGTKVPMFITHKKGLVLDGSNPTLLYGYGGFNIPMTPGFSVANIPWLEMGGVYAVANLRGGGEYGEEWHQAGMKLNKQNVFDDFIAAGEWLVESDYTSPSKLAVFGGSNGGLLVGAVVNQRPDLFGAAIPAVGVMDMLRFNKFTIGWAWESDYGSPENPEEFEALYAYSPYHNLTPGTAYPSVMVTTADHDDRVVPAHSFKYAAALQHAHAGENPVLIRIETRAGHGAGTPTSKQIEQAADRWAFLVRELGVDAD